MEKDFYSRDTIDAKFQSVHERFDVQDKALDKILIQTTKTNGSVAELQKQMAETVKKDEFAKVKITLLIVATVAATLLISSGSELVGFIMSII